MKQSLQYGSLILGFSLLIGCGGPPPQPPAPTAQDYEKQQEIMKESMQKYSKGGGAAPATQPAKTGE